MRWADGTQKRKQATPILDCCLEFAQQAGEHPEESRTWTIMMSSLQNIQRERKAWANRARHSARFFHSASSSPSEHPPPTLHPLSVW